MARRPRTPDMSNLPAPPPVPGRESNGHFAPGNQLAVGNKGNRNKIFHDEAQLYQAFLDYTAYVDANPYLLPKQAQFKGRPVDLNDKQMRPYSVTGFLKHAGIWARRWSEWKKGDKARPDLAEAIEQIEAEIYDQKLSGAIANIFSGMVTTRDLKLAERTEVGGFTGAPAMAFTIAPIQAGTFLPPMEGAEFPAAAPAVAQNAQAPAPMQPQASKAEEPEPKKQAPPALVAGEWSRTAADDQVSYRYNPDSGNMEQFNPGEA